MADIYTYSYDLKSLTYSVFCGENAVAENLNDSEFFDWLDRHGITIVKD